MTGPTEVKKQDPIFAKDYVAHQPTEFSLSRAVTATGEVHYLISFIDSMLEPEIVGEQHSAREKRQIRSTVQVPKAFFDDIVRVASDLEQQYFSAVKART